MRSARWIFLLVVLSVVPLLPTSAQDDTPFQHTACADGVDLTGQTIPLYNLIDPTDQTVTVYDPIHAGYSDAADYFNAHGGICGATVTPEYDDPWTGTLPAYSHIRIKTPKPVLVTLYGSGDGEAMFNYLAHDEIPALNVRAGSLASAYGQDGQTLGWEFLTNPLYADQLGAMCDYIAANPDRFSKPVIGFINFDDDWAMSATEQGRGYCASLGIGYAGTSTFSNDSSSIHAQIQNLIDGGANILYTNSIENGPEMVAQTLADMGLKGKVTLAAVNRAMDPPYIALSDATALDADGVPVISGMIGSVPSRTAAEQDNAGIQLIHAQADLHQRSTTMRSDDDYIIGWDTTDLFIEAYIQTGNRVGFDHITGADMKETLENIVYTPLGGVQQIDYHGGTRRALSENRIGVVEYLGQDGKTAASATNPPLTVKQGEQQVLVPMVMPLTDYATAPDLRPGAAVPSSAATPEATAMATPAVALATTNKILFETRRTGNSEIFVMNADGSAATDLTNNPGFDGEPLWSPDGKHIAYTCGNESSPDLCVMNADGSGSINLTNNPADDELPTWSPDSQRIAFLSSRDSNNDVYVMNADGSNVVRLTDTPAFDGFPSWSPDGKRIVFSSDRDGNSELYVMNADGSDPVRLTDTPADEIFPNWSPDGTQILFQTNQDGNDEIYVMNADGSNPVNLTVNPSSDGGAMWSPDGGQIIFNSDRSGQFDIYSMNADGRNLTQISTEGADWPSWQP